MAVHEIRVGLKEGLDPRGLDVFYEAQRTIGVPGLERIETNRVFWVEGTTKKGAEKLAKQLLADPVTEVYTVNTPLIKDAPHTLHVGPQAGIMNTEAMSIVKAASDLGVPLTAADSSTIYAFYGGVDAQDVAVIADRLLVNKTVQRVIKEKPKTLIVHDKPGPVTVVPIREASPEELMEVSRDKLFLNLDEMQTIQMHFRDTVHRDPTDVELELIAARWSEHCVHKTFKAEVVVDGEVKDPFFTRIRATAQKYFGEFVRSAFEDNSGVIAFADGWNICGKVETHNGPSALDPFGGANTGVGGVVRDILGTGKGAKVLISTNMHCFASPDLDPALLPPGTLHPDYIQRGVIAGVQAYGNQYGVPTNNGSIHYQEGFVAKPAVIVGAYGIMPEEATPKGKPRIQDRVVVIGGRTGRDGLHGATFSSGEMTDRTATVNATAVQIGNAIEEERVGRVILAARDMGLIHAITDCGAAGFSSAIGEMGEETGVTVDIRRAPTKYPGLKPWEIWLSEAQERMVLAVPPEHMDQFAAVCAKYNVEMSDLGVFDGNKRLTVKYGEQTVADLDYDFLTRGLPQRVMLAHYEKPFFDEPGLDAPEDWVGEIKQVLSHGNVCSKQPVLERYDHGVQGTMALPPFSGPTFDGPNDAAVITPFPGKPYGMVVSHGLNPVLNKIDPYWGSVWAATEAMANYVAVGGDPDECALINNYIAPFPDEESMGSLDRMVDAVVDFMDAVERPVVSGKDSLGGTYRKDGQVIKIPPVLCMSAFGRIPDVRQTVTSDIKQSESGSKIYLVGAMDTGMGGSTRNAIAGMVGNEVPKVNLEVLPGVLRGVHTAIKSGGVLACHDVSEGGVISAVAEMAFGGDCGVRLGLSPEMARPEFLFNETAGVFLVEVESDEKAVELFGHLPYIALGTTTREKEIVAYAQEEVVFSAPTDELKQAWQEPMRRIFP